MNSFGTWVMRSVYEVFRPLLPEPNLVSESPQASSQNVTVGPQFESQAGLTQTSQSPDCCDDCSRCETMPCSDSQEREYTPINTYLSSEDTDRLCLSSTCPLLFLLFGQSFPLSCQILLDHLEHWIKMCFQSPHRLRVREVSGQKQRNSKWVSLCSC